MPANTSPIFTLTPVIGIAQISTGNVYLDGSGTIVDVLTGGTNGTRVHRITVQAAGAVTAGMVRLFIHNGAGSRLWKEVGVVAVTPAASTPAFTATVELLAERALVLPSGYKLQASTHNAEGFNVVAEGGDY